MRVAAQEEEEDKLRCFHTEVLTEQLDMDVLPKDAVVIQFLDASSALMAATPILTASDVAELMVTGQVRQQPSAPWGSPELVFCLCCFTAASLRYCSCHSYYDRNAPECNKKLF